MQAHFVPTAPADVVGNQPALKALAAALASDGRFVLVSGAPGCGKSALCRVAMRDAIVLDVAQHYSQHQQNLHSNPNVQKDPKHLISSFATTKTMDQFVSRAVKVVWIDDAHVAAARDRSLMSCVVALSSNPLARHCKFVLCTDDNQVPKLAEFVKATSATHVRVASLTYKHVFQHAAAVLTGRGVEFDDERLLKAAKASKGNWHDFVSNVDHWMRQGDARVTRDALQGMTSRELVHRMLYECATVKDALHMSEYDCGDMFMLAYENWVNVAKPRMAKRSPDVLRRVLSIQDAFWQSFLMDAQLGTFDIDYEGKAISTAYRYGKLVSELVALRSSANKHDAMTSIVPRMYTSVSRKHPGDLLSKQGLVPQQGDLLWSVVADCAVQDPGA
jgi:hypothetical protein